MKNKSAVQISHALGRHMRRLVLGGIIIAAGAALAVLGDNGVPMPVKTEPMAPTRVPACGLATGMDTPELVVGEQAVKPAPGKNSAVPCNLQGSCTKKGLVINFNLNWCCPTGTGCVVKAGSGSGWVNPARWFGLNIGACVIATGCS